MAADSASPTVVGKGFASLHRMIDSKPTSILEGRRGSLLPGSSSVSVVARALWLILPHSSSFILPLACGVRAVCCAIFLRVPGPNRPLLARSVGTYGFH